MEYGGVKTARSINGYISPMPKSEFVTYVSTGATAEDFAAYEEALEEEFKNKSVDLTSEDNPFVSSVYIDGSYVKIELTNGNVHEGMLDDLHLSDITLDKFHMYDSEHYTALVDEPDEEPQYVNISVNDNVKVLNEFKALGDKDSFDLKNNIYHIDISKCKNVWLSNMEIYQSEIDSLFSNDYIETLIIDDSTYLNDTRDATLTINAPNLKNLMISLKSRIYMTNMRNIDLSGCPNIENLSIGNFTAVESLDFVRPLEKLKRFSLGIHPFDYTFDMDKTFEQKILSIEQNFDTTKYFMGKTDVNLITDLSPLMGKKYLEVLNICSFNQIRNAQFLELVESLPSFKKIVGLEVNNADLSSEELVNYCTENGIKHPFTEKSLAIKHKIDEILSEIITPDMSDFEKIKAISQYIVDNFSYYYGAKDKSETEITPEIIETAWGENEFYSIMYGVANCTGYTASGENLLKEAGFNVYSSTIPRHIFTIVEVGGIYYELDLTALDTFINKYYDGDSNAFSWNVGEACYLVPISDESAIEPYALTSDAVQQNPDFIYYNPSDESAVKVPKRDTSPIPDNDLQTLLTFLCIGLASQALAYDIKILLNDEKRRFKESIAYRPLFYYGNNSPFWTIEDYDAFIRELEQSQQYYQPPTRPEPSWGE